MGRLTFYIFSAIMLSLLANDAIAQIGTLPSLTDIKVVATVDTVDSKLFSYSYAVQNGSQSRGDIFNIEIDIKTSPNKVEYDTTGLSFKYEYVRDDFSRTYPSVSDSIIPVGFADYPKWWLSGITVRYTASFGGSLIKPGESQEGFTLVSKAPPGIRSYKVSPYYDPSNYYPSVDEVESVQEIRRIDSLVTNDRKELPVRGQTIGPVAPAKNFVPNDFLDSLQNYLSFSCDTTWITNKGICRSLKAKLQSVQKQLGRGNTKAASGPLEAFLNEVEAQNGKKISSEAYALLKFNGEYLLEKL